MLVTFKTPAFSDITMFGDVAVSLLKAMGQSGNVPGALMADDIPPALEKLDAALATAALSSSGDAAASHSGAGDSEGSDTQVSMATRAGPLQDLLKAAAESGDSVIWES